MRCFRRTCINGRPRLLRQWLNSPFSGVSHYLDLSALKMTSTKTAKASKAPSVPETQKARALHKLRQTRIARNAKRKAVLVSSFDVKIFVHLNPRYICCRRNIFTIDDCIWIFIIFTIYYIYIYYNIHCFALRHHKFLTVYPSVVADVLRYSEIIVQHPFAIS